MASDLASVALYPPIAWSAVAGLLLLCAAVVRSDFVHRRIPNAYCLAIAGLAVVWWFAEGGWAGFVGFLKHLGVPLLAAVPLFLLYAKKAFGGGDVKLVLALLLWVHASEIWPMTLITAISGAVLAIVLKCASRRWRRIDARSVPYGIAIVAGALSVLIPRFASMV